MDDLEFSLGILKWGGGLSFLILMAFVGWIVKTLDATSKILRTLSLSDVSHGGDIKSLKARVGHLEKAKENIEKEINEIKLQLAKKGK